MFLLLPILLKNHRDPPYHGFRSWVQAMPASVVPSGCKYFIVGKVRPNTLASAYNADSRIRTMTLRSTCESMPQQIQEKNYDQEAITENSGQSLTSLQNPNELLIASWNHISDTRTVPLPSVFF